MSATFLLLKLLLCQAKEINQYYFLFQKCMKTNCKLSIFFTKEYSMDLIMRKDCDTYGINMTLYSNPLCIHHPLEIAELTPLQLRSQKFDF